MGNSVDQFLSLTSVRGEGGSVFTNKNNSDCVETHIDLFKSYDTTSCLVIITLLFKKIKLKLRKGAHRYSYFLFSLFTLRPILTLMFIQTAQEDRDKGTSLQTDSRINKSS